MSDMDQTQWQVFIFLHIHFNDHVEQTYGIMNGDLPLASVQHQVAPGLETLHSDPWHVPGVSRRKREGTDSVKLETSVCVCAS